MHWKFKDQNSVFYYKLIHASFISIKLRGCFYLINAAKRLARALPLKPSGISLNNDNQDRGRNFFCCSTWYSHVIKSLNKEWYRGILGFLLVIHWLLNYFTTSCSLPLIWSHVLFLFFGYISGFPSFLCREVYT